jgi:hypothetical protein
MSGGCSSRLLLGCIGVLIVGWLSPPPAEAFQALNGRFQAHGYVESQMRVLSEDYTDHWDVAQWYNILNLEFELDVLRNTWGPIDLLSAFVRVEARFDCIYSRGCGMFRSMNLYGDRGKSLPNRLNDATHGTKEGAIWLPTVGLPEDATDPFAFVDRNPGRNLLNSGQTSIFLTLSQSTGVDGFNEANPCEPLNPDDPPCSFLAGGENADPRVRDWTDDAWPYMAERFLDFGFTAIHKATGAEGWIGPWFPENTLTPIGLLVDRVNPFRYDTASPPLQGAVWNAAFLDVYETPPDLGAAVAAGEAALDDLLLGTFKGELPFRPVPERNYEESFAGLEEPRGVYYPPAGLQKVISGDQLDSFDFNFSETERAWNRGASQQDHKELKEAYIDLETLDSRLWLRIGLQHIVWGKTELFRAVDQFNPRDLALASLPSLEESRIGLWAVRGVYSFYQVGPLDDVRLELAFNFDQFEPNDLGACGEAYTPNPVCESATWGAYTHGILGVGLAGTDRPPDPWDSFKGWEIGGRAEFRYDRFSFAISDFWGFDDMSYTDLITVYQRNVDPVTGRPRQTGINGPGTGLGDIADDCETGLEPACLTGNPPDVTDESDGFYPEYGDFYEDSQGLLRHHANQQMFSFICASTIGYSTLDPTACSLTIFNSQVPITVVTTSQFASGFAAGSSIVVSTMAGLPLENLGTEGYRLPLVALKAGADDLSDPGDAANPSGCLDYTLTPSGVACGGGGSGILSLFSETLGQTLTPEQEALLGCGPFWGTQCDDAGIDVMNADASVLLQSWPGVEGTSYTSLNRHIRDYERQCSAEYGTPCFVGGPPTVGRNSWRTDYFFDLNGDGVQNCNDLNGNGACDPDEPPDVYVDQPATLGWVVNGYGGPVGTTGDFAADWSNVQLPGVRSKWTQYDRASMTGFGLNPDWDPAEDGDPDGLVHPFTGQPWANELAPASWNLLVLTAVLSAEFTESAEEKIASGDYATNALAYEAAALDPERCSLVKPQMCGGTKGLIGISGVTRNTVRAGGNGTFGRRTFQWHSGGVALRRYDRRNVLGFSMDFAEDRTKTAFSIEAAWFSKYRVADNDSSTGLAEVDTYNLTISMDRPTFVRFFNRSRPIFFNSQFFLQYIHGYKNSFPSNGPVNFLMTLSAGTAYHQDRLVSGATFVFDAKSRSGAVMTGISYRFTQSFSASLNAAWFFGRDQLVDMPLVEATAALNRNHYKVRYQGGLSAVRDRDELSLRLRYSF